MKTTVKFAIGDSAYPARLKELASPPAAIWATGDLRANVVVAIVGSRKATGEGAEFAYQLAFEVAARGGVVVSGGARGIDAAAHRGALAAGGRTWAVAPNGSGRFYPPQHKTLFDEIAHSSGAMIWPFPPGTPPTQGNFLRRNRVLAALAHAVVVPQAAFPSGALGAVAQARAIGRAVWAAVGAPWMAEFEGGRMAVRQGAQVLVSKEQVLRGVGLRLAQGEGGPAGQGAREAAIQQKILAILADGAAFHPDEICALTQIAAGDAGELMAALMLLVLGGHVVAAADGSFQIR